MRVSCGIILCLVLLSVLASPVSGLAATTGAHFNSGLEADPLPYEALYNDLWSTFSDSVFGDRNNDYYKAIWAACFLFAILGFMLTGSSRAFNRIAYYWFMVLFFLTPMFGGQFLFPYLCNLMDQITMGAVNIIVVGNDYHAQTNGSFDDVGAMSTVALRNVLLNKSVASKLQKFNDECWQSAVEKAKKDGNWNMDDPPNALEIDMNGLSTKEGGVWAWITEGRSISCISYRDRLKSDISQAYREALGSLKNKYVSMLSSNLTKDAQTLYDKMYENALTPEFEKQVFLASLSAVGKYSVQNNSNRFEDGSFTERFFNQGGNFLSSAWWGELGRKLMSVPSNFTLMFKIYSMVHLLSRYLPDIIGSMKSFVIVAFFVGIGFSLLTGDPKWIIGILGAWLFLDSIYIANAVASRVRYEYIFDSGGWYTAVSTFTGMLGANVAIMRGGIAYLATMIAAVALSGLISWKTISIATAFAGTVGIGATPKAKNPIPRKRK